MRPIRSRLLIAACPFVLMGLVCWSGCRDGRVVRYPVQGTVLVDGQPADGAFVFLFPLDGSEEVMKLRPYGITDANGTFTLSSLSPNDGSPVGEFAVTVRWPDRHPTQMGNGNEKRSGLAGYDRLNGRYTSPTKSPLKVTITAGQNELPPFELTSR